MLQVSEKKVRSLLHRVGYDANDWSKEKLTKRLGSFGSLYETGKVVELSDEEKNLRDELIEANDSGEDIVVLEGSEELSVSEQASEQTQVNGEVGMSSNSSVAVVEKVARVKKEKVAPSAKKAVIAKDYLGNRLGTSAAHINTFLSKTPISVKDLAERSGCTTPRVHDQIFMLKQKGLLEKTDKGYALTDNAVAK